MTIRMSQSLMPYMLFNGDKCLSMGKFQGSCASGGGGTSESGSDEEKVHDSDIETDNEKGSPQHIFPSYSPLEI